jgi:DNA processing protein
LVREEGEGFVGLRITKLSPSELLGRPLNPVEEKYAPEVLYVAGPMPIPIPSPRVAVIGTRHPTPAGIRSTQEIVGKLVEGGVIVVSGLARGIDTVAHRTAMERGGRTIAVLGTPLNRFYPPENRPLQERIASEHLVVTQYPIGHPTQPKDFVLRNRTMALISQASIIVEAGRTSGVISQGWETLRLGRPLFLWHTLLEKDLGWPERMLDYGAYVLRKPTEIKRIVDEFVLSGEFTHIGEGALESPPAS